MSHGLTPMRASSTIRLLWEISKSTSTTTWPRITSRSPARDGRWRKPRLTGWRLLGLCSNSFQAIPVLALSSSKWMLNTSPFASLLNTSIMWHFLDAVASLAPIPNPYVCEVMSVRRQFGDPFWYTAAGYVVTVSLLGTLRYFLVPLQCRVCILWGTYWYFQ